MSITEVYNTPRRTTEPNAVDVANARRLIADIEQTLRETENICMPIGDKGEVLSRTDLMMVELYAKDILSGKYTDRMPPQGGQKELLEQYGLRYEGVKIGL